LPKVIDVGVTPTSDAVLPAVPVQSLASEAGEKLKPLEVGVVGVATVPLLWLADVATFPPAAAAGPVLPPTTPGVVPAVDPAAAPAVVVVVVVVAAAACVWLADDVPDPPCAGDEPRYGATLAPQDVATTATAVSPSSAADLLPTSAPR
jgi:hypothetical protein